jgi:Spy/CpxP family protein refolding chaperone
MKRDLLLYLVIFSLALNVGTIGAFAYLRYQDGHQAAAPEPAPALPMRELLGKLNLDQEQLRTLKGLAPEHRRQVRDLRRELALKRQELTTLLKAPEPPAWPTVQAKIREIGELQGKLQEEVVHHLLKVQAQLKPEQRTVVADFFEQKLMFPPEVGGMGRRGRGMGPGRGRGMGPGQSPDCPMPPAAPGPPPAGERPL